MEVTWQSRFCIRMRSREATVATDPFPADVGPTGRGLTADIVTISHVEPVPAGALRQLRKVVTPAGKEILVPASLEKAFVLDGPGEFEVRQVLITGVRTPPGDGDGQANVAFVYELDGIHVCHLGDVGAPLTEEQLGEIGPVELLCIPVGGRLNANVAAELVAQLDPQLVVPLTVNPDPAVSAQALDRFVHEMGASKLEPQAKLSVSISTVPEDTTLVLLEPRGRS
jgi:L-ascorbate metabolism protein UlaG (beta-lactamase superfamily)